MKRYIHYILILLIGLPAVVNAQDDGNLLSAPTDPAYITNLSHQLTLRGFISRKIIGYQVGKQGEEHEVEYSPNDVTSVGVGFSYRAFGLNLNFKVPGLNNDDDKYGKTKSLDLATYFYLRKLTIDGFVQVYKGHYLSDNDLIASRLATPVAIIRPDLQTQFYGVNAQYVFNHDRFSYRASFLQNEWQRRSAGSFLAGINIHHVRVKADSAIMPSFLLESPETETHERFSETQMSSIGVNGGYAHTFVFREHWFATISGTVGVGGNRTTLANDAIGLDESGLGLHMNATIRGAIGYNSLKWFVGAFYVNFLNRNYMPVNDDAMWQQTANGLYRFVVARRFPFREGRGTANVVP